MPPSMVCRVDAAGNVGSTSAIELKSGQPFITGHGVSRVAAVDLNGHVVDVSATDPVVLTRARADAVYGFDESGELLELRTSGELRTADGALIAGFAIDGAVDLPSGVDVFGGLVAFTVASGSGGFAVVIGDMDTGEVREVQRSDRYIGQARWSPDGAWLAMVGPDYRSLWVVSAADRQPTQEITSTDPRLSGRFNSPSWIDDDTIAFVDAIPALVRASRETGRITVIRIYGADGDAVPALPVALSQPPS